MPLAKQKKLNPRSCVISILFNQTVFYTHVGSFKKTWNPSFSNLKRSTGACFIWLTPRDVWAVTRALIEPWHVKCFRNISQPSPLETGTISGPFHRGGSWGLLGLRNWPRVRQEVAAGPGQCTDDSALHSTAAWPLWRDSCHFMGLFLFVCIFKHEGQMLKTAARWSATSCSYVLNVSWWTLKLRPTVAPSTPWCWDRAFLQRTGDTGSALNPEPAIQFRGGGDNSSGAVPRSNFSSRVGKTRTGRGADGLRGPRGRGRFPTLSGTQTSHTRQTPGSDFWTPSCWPPPSAYPTLSELAPSGPGPDFTLQVKPQRSARRPPCGARAPQARRTRPGPAGRRPSLNEPARARRSPPRKIALENLGVGTGEANTDKQEPGAPTCKLSDGPPPPPSPPLRNGFKSLRPAAVPTAQQAGGGAFPTRIPPPPSPTPPAAGGGAVAKATLRERLRSFPLPLEEARAGRRCHGDVQALRAASRFTSQPGGP